jgi:integrase/recombinase XerC
VIRLQDEIGRFLERLKEKDASPATVTNYGFDLAKFERWYRETTGQEMDLSAVGPLDIAEFRQHLLNRGQKPTSINRALAALSAFFEWAVKEGYARTNPVREVKRVRQVAPAPKSLGRKDMLRLMRAVRAGGNTRDIAIVTLLLHTGLRVAELCSLQTEDLKLGERSGEVRVRYGKGMKERIVPLNATARRALQDWLEERGDAPGPVFTRQKGFTGEGLTPRRVQYMIRDYAIAAGLEGVSPHTLRHTFCKSLVDAGESLDRVAALAGHANLNTTARYTQPTRKDLQKAVDRLAWE